MDNVESVDEMDNVEFELEGGLNENQCVESDSDMVYNPQVATELKPKIGQEFQTIDDVFNFYNAYSKASGFSVRNWSEKKRQGSNEIIRKEFVCWKQGKGTTIANIEATRRRRSIKENCNAKLAVVMSSSGLYIVSIFVEGHSHPLSTPRKTQFLPSHRNVSNAQKTFTQQLHMVNIPSHQQFNLLGVQAGGFENIGCTQRDLYNHERDKRNELKGHYGNMLNEFLMGEQGKNPSFYFKIESDDDNRITHCFLGGFNF
jgi:hypothetical protein